MGHLNLYQRLARNTTGLAFYGDLDHHARRYRRSSRAIGGYWMGSFRLTTETMNRAELTDFFDNFLGCRFVETTYGMVTWEGYVVEMYLGQDGSTFQRSLSTDLFANQVRVMYSNAIGAQRVTATAENTDSQSEYGVMANTLTIGQASSTGALALRDTTLTEFGWPRSRDVGTIEIDAFGGAASEDVLEVGLAGYWHSMNWEYQTASNNAHTDLLLAYLVGLTDYVTVGRIEDNADDSESNAYPIPRRRAELIQGIIEQGDSSGNIWQGGVYAGRKFIYEPAPTDWTYQKVGTQILDKGGTPPLFEAIQPGFLLFNANAPTGSQPPGTSSVWDDPRYRYIDEVEFMRGENGGEDQLRLRSSRDTEIAVIQSRLSAGPGAPLSAAKWPAVDPNSGGPVNIIIPPFGPMPL